MTIEPERRAQLEDALGSLGLAASAIEVLSPPAPAKRHRALYRADLADGAVVKLRVLEDDGAAAALFAHRVELGPAFAPAIGVRGAVIVELWVVGTPAIEVEPSPARAAEAGTVLGELHGRALGPATPSAGWIDTARSDLATLVDDGCVTVAEATALEGLLATGDPGTFDPVLIHRDFCVENFVVDEGGTLRVIDNEWFCPGPAGFDVGRTRNRWTMTDAEQEAFDAAYRRTAGAPADEALWGLVADLFGARVEHVWVSGRERPILERVRARAAGRAP